jgi:hypothetical protein
LARAAVQITPLTGGQTSTWSFLRLKLESTSRIDTWLEGFGELMGCPGSTTPAQAILSGLPFTLVVLKLTSSLSLCKGATTLAQMLGFATRMSWSAGCVSCLINRTCLLKRGNATNLVQPDYPEPLFSRVPQPPEPILDNRC